MREKPRGRRRGIGEGGGGHRSVKQEAKHICMIAMKGRSAQYNVEAPFPPISYKTHLRHGPSLLLRLGTEDGQVAGLRGAGAIWGVWVRVEAGRVPYGEYG